MSAIRSRPRRGLGLLLCLGLLGGCSGPDPAPPGPAPAPDLGLIPAPEPTPEPGGGDDGEEPSDDVPISEPVGSFYPRPGAPDPSFTPTPPPAALPAHGSVVALLDLPVAATPSADAAAVRHALSTMGVPSEVIRDLSELSRYPVAMLTGELSGATVRSRVAAQIAEALDGGTTVVAFAPSAERLYALLGVAGGAARADRTALVLGPDSDAATATLAAAGLGRVTLGTPGAGVQGRGYQLRSEDELPTGAETPRVLARFEDGSAAVVARGRLYAVGLKPRYHAELMGGNSAGLAAHPDGGAPVQGALLPLLLRDLYAGRAPSPQLRQLAPAGRRAAVILTHDCDSAVSYQKMGDFMAMERRAGVTSTFLITTSPYSNGHTSRVYREETVAAARAALAGGFDVGSHSFAHMPDLPLFPRHIAGESAATYRPIFRGGASEGASLTGEIQLSRWLLQTDIGVPIAAFRPGHLAFPRTYYEELAAAGYRRSSVRTTAVVRTSFPYQALEPSGGGYALRPIIEYPLAITDRGLTGDNVAARVADWLATVEQNARLGAPTVLLLHTSGRPGKEAALSAFLAGLAGRDLWVGDWASYARFYEDQGF